MSITASLIAPITAASIAGGFDIPTWVYNDVDSATYKVGAPLVVSAGAELTEATSGAPPITGIVGIAVQAGTNNATAPEYPNYGLTYPAGSATQGTSTAGTASAVGPLLVVPALPGIVFEGTLANAGSDYAVGSDGSNVYVKYGLTKDSGTGYWYVNVGLTTTNANVLVIGIKNPQDVTFGTTKGVRCYFVFLQDGTLYTTQA